MTTRAVFVCLDTLGDLTLRQPLFAAVLDAGFDVTVVVREAFAPLLPHLDARLAALTTDVDPYRPAVDSLAGMEALAARIEAAAPDLLVLTAWSRTPVDEFLLRRVTVSRRVAFAGAGPAVAERTVDAGASDHEVEKNRRLAEALLERALPPAEPRLSVDDATRGRARAHLAALGLAPGRYVLGCPGGTANNALKGWPAAPYAELVVHLHERHGLPVLLTGLAGEAPRMDAIARAAAVRDVPVARHVGSGDLSLLLGLVAESRLYLGADTGPMHFAGALDVPAVALFGGGHWPRFLPRARRSCVLTQELPCFGCGWDCFLPEPACLTTVDPSAARDAVDWILSDAPDERRVHRGTPLAPAAERLVRGARVRYDERTAELARVGAQAEDAERRLADLARVREDDVRTLAGLLHATEQDSLQRLRNMEALERVIADQHRVIAEQEAVLARRSVKIARKLKLP